MEEMRSEDFYTTLGVKEDASAGEIESAYDLKLRTLKGLSLEMDDWDLRMAHLHGAYLTLRDKSLREDYDSWRAGGGTTNGPPWGTRVSYYLNIVRERTEFAPGTLRNTVLGLAALFSLLFSLILTLQIRGIGGFSRQWLAENADTMPAGFVLQRFLLRTNGMNVVFLWLAIFALCAIVYLTISYIVYYVVENSLFLPGLGMGGSVGVWFFSLMLFGHFLFAVFLTTMFAGSIGFAEYSLGGAYRLGVLGWMGLAAALFPFFLSLPHIVESDVRDVFRSDVSHLPPADRLSFDLSNFFAQAMRILAVGIAPLLVHYSFVFMLKSDQVRFGKLDTVEAAILGSHLDISAGSVTALYDAMFWGAVYGVLAVWILFALLRYLIYPLFFEEVVPPNYFAYSATLLLCFALLPEIWLLRTGLSDLFWIQPGRTSGWFSGYPLFFRPLYIFLANGGLLALGTTLAFGALVRLSARLETDSNF